MNEIEQLKYLDLARHLINFHSTVTFQTRYRKNWIRSTKFACNCLPHELSPYTAALTTGMSVCLWAYWKLLCYRFIDIVSRSAKSSALFAKLLHTVSPGRQLCCKPMTDNSFIILSISSNHDIDTLSEIELLYCKSCIKQYNPPSWGRIGIWYGNNLTFAIIPFQRILYTSSEVFDNEMIGHHPRVSHKASNSTVLW